MRKNGKVGLLFGIGMILALIFPWLRSHAVPTASHQSSTANPVASGPSVGSTSYQLRELLLSPRGVEVAPKNLAKPVAGNHARLDQAYGKLPLSFEANQGQTDRQVKFLSRGRGYTLFLTPTEAVFVFAKREATAKRDKLRDPKPELRQPGKITQTVVRMRLVGANPKPPIAGREELPGKVNYIIGNDPTKWRTDVPTYAQVEYQDVYPGVNLVYYGNQRRLEYDFVVAPGADPKAIRLAFEGVDKLSLDAQGNLILRTPSGEVVQRAPLVYQQVDGRRQEVAGGYVLNGKDRVSFRVAFYDQTKPLVIDPVLVYSTYLGGSGGDYGSAIAVDTDGNAYVAGNATSLNFPTANPLQAAFGGGSSDVFVAKLNPTGSALVYSTYLGGSGDDFSRIDIAGGIAVDGAGNAYVAGTTNSVDFPTANPIQPTLLGVFDVFVAKLNPTGSALVYSTYLGGSGDDRGGRFAVDGSGNAYVTGVTNSTDFPTLNAFQGTSGGGLDAFVAKLNPMGSGLVYSTYLGGTGNDFGRATAVDGAGNGYVTGVTTSTNFPTANPIQANNNGGNGVDGFVAKLDAAGTALVYSTYLGGSGFEDAVGIAVDASGNASVTGVTNSTDFPTVSALQPIFGGVFDVFAAKVNSAGDALVYSTYLGGSDHEFNPAIAVDAAGYAYVTGLTSSTDFPTANPMQAMLVGSGNAFVAELNPTGSAFVYSTYLGGSGFDQGLGIAVDAAGNAYVTGSTASPDFPAANPFQPQAAGSGQAFVAKLNPSIPSFNTPLGSNVTVPLGSGASVSFPSISSQGSTSATTSSTGPTPPSGFSLGTTPTYYDIATTASFTGPAKVCIMYDPAQFSDPDSLRLLHYESDVWVDVTTSNVTIPYDPVRAVICGEVSSFSPFVIAQAPGSPLTSLGPANVWVGLKNSDDVGIRFDLRAEVYRNGTQLVGSGEVASVPGGSSGFNNAKLNAIALIPIGGVSFLSGETLSIKLLVRNACTGSGKNSGTARLWFNDAAADSRVEATIGSPVTYYLRDGFALATTPGPGPKQKIDVAAGAKCSPFKSFGTWSLTLP